MSQVTKRVCDKCGKEIESTIDSGYVHIDYSNSLGYMQTHGADFCGECSSKIIAPLRTFLNEIFPNTDEEAKGLEDFFTSESRMIESMKQAEEEAKRAEEEAKKENEAVTEQEKA